jgi:hypothetical protein
MKKAESQMASEDGTGGWGLGSLEPYIPSMEGEVPGGLAQSRARRCSGAAGADP